MKKIRYLVIFLVGCGFSVGLFGQSPVTYFFADQNVCAGDTLQVPMRARDFINVRNFQSSVRWNAADLTFQSLTEIHPQLAANFLINTDSVDNGGLGYFWLDNSSGEPLVLADSSLLFVLKFIPSSGVGMTAIGFGELPTLTETVVENNGVPMQVNSTQLSAEITKYEVTATAEIQPATTNNNGQINQTITSGQAPFSFLWNTGATTEDLENLAPENYNVTITDAQGCTASFDYVVEMSTSTKNDFTNSLVLSPNPTHDYLSIHFMNTNISSIYQYKLYDSRANIIFQKTNLNPEFSEKVNLQNQSSGLYFLEIKTEKNRKIFKVLKK